MTTTMAVNSHAKTIEELDRVLISTLRNLWVEARDPKEKEKWRKSLDDALDERLRLMKSRDAK